MVGKLSTIIKINDFRPIETSFRVIKERVPNDFDNWLHLSPSFTKLSNFPSKVDDRTINASLNLIFLTSKGLDGLGSEGCI